MQRETCNHPRPWSFSNHGFLRLTGVLAALLGGLVLLGWSTNSVFLKSVLPGLAPMRPLAAFSFVCTGVGFLALPIERRWARLIVLLNVFLIAIPGISTLAIGLWPGAMVPLREDSGFVMKMAQMASISAVNFVLTAAGLALMSLPRKMAKLPFILAVIGSLVFAFGLMIFSGYVANLAAGAGWWDVTGMALHSSLAFVLIGLTILQAAWEQAGLRWLIGRNLAICFLCGLAFFALVATNSYRSTREMLDAAESMRHSHTVVAASQQLWADIVDNQSAVRAYLVSGEREFLSASLKATVGIHAHFDRIRSLTLGNPRQRARLEKLEPMIVEWMEGNRVRVEAREQSGIRPNVATQGPVAQQRIRTALDHLEKEEYALLAQGEGRSAALIRKAFAILPVGTLLSLFFLGTGLFLLNREVIQRQVSTEALESSEERLRSLVVASSQMVWVSSPDGNGARPLLSRDEVFESTNKTERFFPDKFSAIHPEDRDRVQSAWEQALKSATPCFAEYRARESDGTYRDYATRVAPVFASGGKLCEWVGASSDITERKQAERAIRLLNAEMEQILHSAGDGIVRLDANGRVLFLNPAAVAMFGWGSDELTGSTFHEKVHSRHADGSVYPREECPVLAALVDAEVHRGSDELYWRKDGSSIALDFISTPLFEEKKVSGVVVLYHDTTVRKQAEEALRRSESNFRELADAMPQIVWTTKADGSIEYFNKRWFAYTGLTRKQSDGWEVVLHPDDLQKCMQKWANACRTGEPYEIEYRFRRGLDGSYRWHLGRALPVMDGKGSIARWFGTSTDIEDQKQAEAQIRRLNETLELRVQERTAALELAVKELEAFSYSVSHDLRAPLRAIDGYSRIVMEDYGATIGSEGARLLGVVRAETQRMGQLIDDLLSFSRVGRQPMQSTMIDMDKLARSVLDDLLGRERGRTIHLAFAELAPVRGERSMLELVWYNLFSNALKFTGRVAEARIEVGCRDEKEERIYHVRDNGAGFDMRFESKLFGVFQRLHGEAQFEGTGVGLALVQRIIHRHGGRVWAEGKVNQGAIFYFAMPISNP